MAKYVTREFKTKTITCSAPGKAPYTGKSDNPVQAVGMYAAMNDVDVSAVKYEVGEAVEHRRMTQEFFYQNSEPFTKTKKEDTTNG